MPKRTPTYDPACYELAQYFLESVNNNDEIDRKMLAIQIQVTIESWIAGREAEREREHDHAQGRE